MDYEARIAKVEATVETNRQDIDRLYQAISELRKLILERTDRLQAEQIAQVAELRKYIDGSLRELQHKMDAGFKEVRQEASTNMRRMVGLTLMNTTMILGMGGRLFGLY